MGRATDRALVASVLSSPRQEPEERMRDEMYPHRRGAAVALTPPEKGSNMEVSS